MKSMLNDTTVNKNYRTGAALQYENLHGLSETNGSLRSFTIITFENATKLGFTSNSVFRLRNEVLVEHRIVSANTSMRPLLVIVFQPHAKDVVELSSTEANEVIQHFPLCCSDEAFAKRVRHRGAWLTKIRD